MVLSRPILALTSFILIVECKMEPFVVGGKDAKIENFPYVAYLGVECIDLEIVVSWVCGASIINQKLLLTAGHCLFGCTEESMIIVNIGHENIMKSTISTAHSFLVHEKYSAKWLLNDIALVKLKTSLKFSKSVSRIALMDKPPYKEEAVLAGWGFIKENPMKSTETLQYITQYVWDKQDCISLVQRLPEGTFCARAKNKSSFASIGDSGSALVVRGYIQIGIMSSKAAKESASLIIYTDVGYFYSWIQNQVHKMLC